MYIYIYTFIEGTNNIGRTTDLSGHIQLERIGDMLKESCLNQLNRTDLTVKKYVRHNPDVDRCAEETKLIALVLSIPQLNP